jgi:ATP-dependent RNA helicase RhlE
MSFEALQLAEPIQRALVESNYGTPTPIQRDAIPVIMKGSDIIGCAQTGSGKTAAFALPVLHHLALNPVELQSKQVRTVVLTPTRELATQVSRSFERYGKYLQVRVETVVGGMPMGPQIKALKGGLEVLVATPGRLLDIIEQGFVQFDRTDHLILDEVDRMFDMGFIQDVKAIIRRIPASRQTLCFSATIDDAVNRLIAAITRNPVQIAVDVQSRPADRVEQLVCFLRNQDKSDLVVHLIKEESERDAASKILIFTSTKQGAEHLRHRMKLAHISCESLHGDKPQNVRERVLEKFRGGSATVLIATDVAARGLDIKGIDLVLNFDIPKEGDTYVHRIGRTARAGKDGRAITFCAEFDQQPFHAIERFLSVRIPVLPGHPFHSEILTERYQKLFGYDLPEANSPEAAAAANTVRRPNRRNRALRR